MSLYYLNIGGNPDLIRESQRRRFQSVEVVDDIIQKDERWRKLTGIIYYMLFDISLLI